MKELEVNKQLPIVTGNFEEVKLSLKTEMEKYKGIVVTEDNLKDCKATQKDIAGLRNKIEGYRKSIKKEMQEPIKEFESKCKELVGLIEEVENPIKDGILIYDNKRREERKAKALEFINAAVIEHRLEDKYAKELTVLDKYMNLSGSIKAIKEDIEARAINLKGKQEAENARLNILKTSIKSTCDLLNKDIKTPLKEEDFYKYIDMGWSVEDINKQIQRCHDIIFEAENPKEEPKVETQKPSTKVEKPSEPVQNKAVQKLYIKIEVIDTLEKMKALSKYMKENGYNYTTLEQKKVD